MINLFPPSKISGSLVGIPGSKSISNRHLVISHLMEQMPLIKNLSDSEDTELLQAALFNIRKKVPGAIDVHDAGTDLRFLTALLSVSEGSHQITGSPRLRERPLKELIDSLRQLGADIVCLETEGFPPLKINGRTLVGGTIEIRADVSSQFVSALLMIAPVLPQGLKIRMKEAVVSRPYIEMTCRILEMYGVEISTGKDEITVLPLKNKITSPQAVMVESDWSSASYWFSICALCPGSEIHLSTFDRQSWQADSVLPALYSQLGVKTVHDGTTLVIKQGTKKTARFEHDFTHSPDIALTLAVTCFALGIPAELKGLKTLEFKESKRLTAIATELKKAGAAVEVSGNAISVGGKPAANIGSKLSIDTYKDHRMAMSFAPLSFRIPGISINDHTVVNKSYPRFWEDLKSVGFNLSSPAQ